MGSCPSCEAAQTFDTSVSAQSSSDSLFVDINTIPQHSTIQSTTDNVHWSDAVLKGKREACQYIYAAFPDVIDTPINEWGQVAIHIAAERKDHKLLLFLLDNKANPDIKSRYDGNTALHFAVVANDRIAIATLLAHGADTNIRNHSNETPKDCANFVIRKQFTRIAIKKAKQACFKKVESRDTIIGGRLVKDISVSEQNWYDANAIDLDFVATRARS